MKVRLACRRSSPTTRRGSTGCTCTRRRSTASNLRLCAATSRATSTSSTSNRKRERRQGGALMHMGQRVISADNHIVDPKDLYVERMPAEFRDRAPRVLRGPDGGD